MAAPDSAIACIMIAASVMPRPAPPYSSGMAMPSQPACASARMQFVREIAAAVLAPASSRRRTGRRA